MQTTTQTWKTLFAAEAWVSPRVTIAGTAYGEGAISELKTAVRLFDSPRVGKCVSRQIDFLLKLALSVNFPRMAQIDVDVQLLGGASTSERLPKGRYFTDLRKADADAGTLRIQGFDAMLKMGQLFLPSGSDIGTWPRTPAAVMSYIASAIGVTIDPRTVLNNSYAIDYPGSEAYMREVAGYIAGMHGGNWCITDNNTLLLVPLMGFTDTAALGKNVESLVTSPALAAWSGVRLIWNNEETFFAGTETGRVLEIVTPWGTQAVANNVLSAIQGKVYQPFTAENALIDPAAELGDAVTVDGTSSILAAITTTYDAMYTAEISAPGEEEVDHEYAFVSEAEMEISRSVKLGRSYYGVTVSREKGIEVARSDGNSEAIFNSDLFTMRAKIDGVMQDRLYFDPAKGDFVFAGALAADAVFTDSLYAEQGDIAELTVDQLSTSRRIRKYNLGDTSDDNYIFIHEQTIQFITGTTQGGQGIQATNRYGEGLYWAREPDSYTADGYPLDEDGVQIYATTTLTAWPIFHYEYTEQVKAQFTFEQLNNIYRPVLTLGAGDQNGNDKAKLAKEVGEFDLLYKTSSGTEIGMKCLLTGYLDLYGLRKTTNIDFSNWDNGTFTETVEGNVTNNYTVLIDSAGRPASITDAAGHVCTITWEQET